MHKKLVATLTIAIFLISTVAIMAPVNAHFTLGNTTPGYRYHANDFDPHVCGIIGYVWPGSGQNAYSGFPNTATNQFSPGYQSPYPGGNPPGSPTNAQQLQGDAYAPFGAVLAGSSGDLIFAINATKGYTQAPDPNFNPATQDNGAQPCGQQDAHTQIQAFSNWFIMIPPGFTIPDDSQIVSTTTNNYEFIHNYGALSPLDRYAPGWTLVRVRGDSYNSGNAPQSIWFNSAAGDQWYYVRINGVTAPTVAGRYFFKMFMRGSSGTTGVGSTTSDGQYWVPTQNWPVMLVKGEVDPAIITGTIRYGGFNSTLYGQGIEEAGRVWAQMNTKLDPYTGAKVMSCPLESWPGVPQNGTAVPGCTDAVGYWNATSAGHYEVEGVAPGVYTIYAEAAGYPQWTVATGVTILKGQSLHFDGYLNPGPVIHGDVNSKHQFGVEPWPESAYIRIDLYANPTLNHVPDASAGAPVVWSPLPCVAGGQDLYDAGGDAQQCGDPRLAGKIAFPWHEYNAATGYSNTPTYTGSLGPVGLGGAGAVLSTEFAGSGKHGAATSTTEQALKNNNLYPDAAGVGPAQNWFVQGGTTNAFHFEMGVKGEYGAPRDWDGMVPQLYATWVNGLTPGRYYVRAWTFRYVQSALDGATFQEYYFDVTSQEWAGDVTLPIDLRLSSWVNKTVYFHNLPGTIQTDSINTGAGYIVGGLYDTNGQKWSYNVTTIPVPDPNHPSDPTQQFSAWDGKKYGTYLSPTHATPLDPANINQFCNTPGHIEFGHCNIQFWGFNDTWLGTNYGIPSGTYQVKVWALGYLQQQTEFVSVTLSGNPTVVSDHLYRGVGFNFTVYSIDWERPRVNRNWVWPTSDIEIGILNNGTFVSEECAGCDAGSYQGPYGGYGHPATESNAYNLTQNSNTYWVQANGGGVNVLGTDNAQGAFFGLETPFAVVGGWKSFAGSSCDVNGLSIACTRADSESFDGTDGNALHYGFTRGKGTNIWQSGTSFYHASAFDSGQYSFRGWTYGYIQNKDFSIYALKGEVADIKINLIVGVNVSLTILFKKESIITGTLANMSARVRLFNDQGVYVAGWMSSEGAYVTGNGDVTAADNTAQFPLMDGGFPGPAGNSGRAVNYVPGGTKLLHVLMASQPGHQGDYGDPILTAGCDWEVDCVDLSRYPNAGILGYPDYTGSWTAEVDFVNWYSNNTGVYTCDLQSATVCSTAGNSHWYPPVSGLLMGESYHIIPGTTAKSGISLTEDNAMDSTFGVGHSMAPNHLGPYSQQGAWVISNAHLSGEASAVFEVDLNGLVSGNALAFTWSNEFRPLSWGLVTVTGASGASWSFYTYDGIYQAYLPPGTYQFTINAPGYASQTWSVSVNPGQNGSGQNLYLEQNNIPVPEFSGIAVVAFSALAASLYLLRRRRR